MLKPNNQNMLEFLRHRQPTESLHFVLT